MAGQVQYIHSPVTVNSSYYYYVWIIHLFIPQSEPMDDKLLGGGVVVGWQLLLLGGIRKRQENKLVFQTGPTYFARHYYTPSFALLEPKEIRF